MKAGTLILKCVLIITTSLTLNSCSEELVPEEVKPISSHEGPMTKSTENFRFGINGHPLGTKPYTSVPATEQMALLKNMGMNIYRFDVMSMSDGSVTVPYLLSPLVKAAREAGVTLLPMLYTRTLDFSVSNYESYQRGKKLGRNFARRYKDLFTYYELGNELDIKCILPNSAGKSRYSYDQKRFKTIAAYLKGMNHGVKLEDPDAKTMISAGWLHYAYLLMLEEHGINFDIIAYHWYSEMESLARDNYDIPDITQRLSDKFDKPIWFTEINARPKDVSDMEQRQNNFLTSFLEKCKRNPQVKAVMIYELFDQPQISSFRESNYGIIKWANPFSDWAPKLAAQNLSN